VVLLLANKTDLPKDCWQVDLKEAETFCECEGLLFHAVSAKTGEGVESSIFKLTEDMHAKGSSTEETPHQLTNLNLTTAILKTKMCC
jgi:hypothetical protein